MLTLDANYVIINIRLNVNKIIYENIKKSLKNLLTTNDKICYYYISASQEKIKTKQTKELVIKNNL